MANTPVEKYQLVCPICGGEFWVGGSAGNLNKVCCSKSCAGIYKGNQSNGFVRKDGYRIIHRGGVKYFEHRFVAEQMMSRPLMAGEIVHHISGDKSDNRPANLAVMSQACHRALVDHLARLWIEEHTNDDGRVAKEIRTFEISFAAGG